MNPSVASPRHTIRRNPAQGGGLRWNVLACTGAMAMLLSAVGCEQRIEEPRAHPEAANRPSSATAVKSSDPDGTTKSPMNAPAVATCIKETPTTAPRTPLVGAAPDCPTDNLDQPPELREAKLTFASDSAPALTVEVAERDADRQRGLMFRTEMAEDRGMIFVFETMRHNRFWMRNTCISLDMLFIDEDGTIVGIEESTPTLSDQGFSVGCKSKYVLEVNGGFCRKHGIVAGQKVSLDGL